MSFLFLVCRSSLRVQLAVEADSEYSVTVVIRGVQKKISQKNRDSIPYRFYKKIDSDFPFFLMASAQKVIIGVCKKKVSVCTHKQSMDKEPLDTFWILQH